MATKGKPAGQGRAIPNAVVYHDGAESKASLENLQGRSLARLVFGPAVTVARAPIAKARVCDASRIRVWRAQ